MQLKEFKDRRIIQILTAYAAISWIILQIVDQVVDRSILPEIVYKITLTLVITMSPGAIVLAWFHGAKGKQKIPSIEKWLLSFVVVISFLSCFFVLRSNLQKTNEISLETLKSFEDPRRIAVMYFEPRGNTADAEIISKGLTEAIIDDLSSIPDLYVVSQNGSEIYRNSDLSLKEIGRSLEVGIIVNGSVSLHEDRVRFRLSLVESLTGRQMESTRIEYSGVQIFDLIDGVTNKVSDFLRHKIGDELNQIELNRSTTDLEAWTTVQKALIIEENATKSGNDEVDEIEELEKADSLFSLAEELDPGWAVPTLRRGWIAYRRARISQNDRGKIEHWVSIGLKHADKALGKEPDNADALELKATLLYWSCLLNIVEDLDATMEKAEDLFNESIKSNPKQASALTSISHLYLNKGWISEAKQAAVTAYNIDPYLKEADRTLWRLVSISYDFGDTQETKRWCYEGLRRFPDDYRFNQGMIQLYTMPGIEPDIDDAWAHYYKCIENCPSYEKDYRSKFCLQLVSMVLAKAELPDSARIVSLKGRATVEEDPTRGIAFLEATARSWTGDIDESIRLMGVFFSANPGVADGYREPYLNRELFWYQDSLYGKPRFETLIGIR